MPNAITPTPIVHNEITIKQHLRGCPGMRERRIFSISSEENAGHAAAREKNHRAEPDRRIRNPSESEKKRHKRKIGKMPTRAKSRLPPSDPAALTPARGPSQTLSWLRQVVWFSRNVCVNRSSQTATNGDLRRVWG